MRAIVNTMMNIIFLYNAESLFTGCKACRFSRASFKGVG
jgi:hypothetical protein